ncbi:protein translocase subunit SecF [Candidatus Daviesbacteria bacterium]|nr:protein translocase subunit SecF [Candidatus Daviesbacteria bacterium]
MIHLMKYKLWFFILSTLVILPGIFYLYTSGLKLGIDFTGGALLEYQFISPKESLTKEALSGYGVVTPEEKNTFIIRTKPLEQDELNKLRVKFTDQFGKFEVRREENVGPVIGEELKQKAILAILLACTAIVLYITYAFRKLPKPASAFRFGIAAIVALIHDVLVVLGMFAIFGKFFNVEIDTLFVTALLTIIGFSVHDTIVVFDRIRENMPKFIGKKFTEVADVSITQTLARSLNTSLTVVFVLLALLLFGGETIKWFVVALLAGVISGTYSSIFNATALLAFWEERLGH